MYYVMSIGFHCSIIMANSIISWVSFFRVCMLIKSTVNDWTCTKNPHILSSKFKITYKINVDCTQSIQQNSSLHAHYTYLTKKYINTKGNNNFALIQRTQVVRPSQKQHFICDSSLAWVSHKSWKHFDQKSYMYVMCRMLAIKDFERWVIKAKLMNKLGWFVGYKVQCHSMGIALKKYLSGLKYFWEMTMLRWMFLTWYRVHHKNWDKTRRVCRESIRA